VTRALLMVWLLIGLALALAVLLGYGDRTIGDLL
jgi:hypothetical protein